MHVSAAILATLVVSLAQDQAQRDVLEREQAIARAVVARDVPFMEKLWGEDFTYTGIRGEVKNRSQVLDEFRDATLRFSKMEFDEIRVRVYGETAVATGRATTQGTSPQGEIRGQFRYTRVYVQREGLWTLVAFQATPIVVEPAS